MATIEWDPNQMACYRYPRPALTADVVLFHHYRGETSVLLIERKKDPYAGSLALPGGFVNVGEEPISAASREMIEETDIPPGRLKLVEVYGKIGRDPREHVISIAYYAVWAHGFKQPVPTAKDDAAKASWFTLNSLRSISQHHPLAFDHGDIIRDAYVKAYEAGELTRPEIS